MKYLLLVFCCLPILLHAQNKVGINVDTPSVELDIRSLSVADGSEISVGNIDNSNFTRLFSGRPGFPHSLLYWKTGYPLLLGTAEEDGASWSEWMRISPTGQVGIGTYDPLFDLDIRGASDQEDGGELQLATPSQTNFLRFFGGRLNDRNPFVAFHEMDTFHIVTTSPDWSTYTRRLSIVPDGNVGIGLPDPSGKLHIWHNSSVGYPNLRITEEGFDYARIKLENSARPGTFWDIAGQADTLPENSRLNFFYSGPYGAGDIMTIRGNGNVGIGTIHPGNRLRVHGSSTSTQHVISASVNYSGNADIRAVEGFATPAPGYGVGGYFVGASRGIQAYGQGTTSSSTTIAVEGIASGTDGTRIGIRGSASGGDVNWAGYFDAGNVYVNNNLGIRTTNPAQPLDVFGDILLGGGNSLYDLDAETAGIRGRSGDWFLGVINASTSAATDFYIETQPSPSGTFHIQRDGNIGIGTTTPGNKLRIHGNPASSQNVLSVSSNYAGTSNVRAVEGFSNALAGYGIGGYFRGGVRGAQVYGDGGSSSGLVIGIEARATGTAGTRMGVFASASGGSTNWAGYFAEGDVYVTNQLRIGDADGATGYRLSVDGKIIAEEVRVMLSGVWPDYVFEEGYHLLPLDELKNVIADKGHLPGVPSASVVDTEGADLGEIQRIMMEKIEELTLYVIQQDEKIRGLEQKLRHGDPTGRGDLRTRPYSEDRR